MQPGVKSCDNLISLYSRIPDYSQVKHLGNSDFIRAVEQLKEEFRQCRAKLLYSEDSLSNGNSDVELITERTSKVLNINSNREKISNTELASSFDKDVGEDNDKYLSVRGCQLHRFVTQGSNFGDGGGGGGGYVNYNKPSRSLSFNFEPQRQRHRSDHGTGTDSAFHEGYDFGDEYDDDNGRRGADDGADTPDSDDSKWSSSPDLREFKAYVPPSNVQKRILERRAINNSAPSLTPAAEEEKDVVFKANPVPSHVYKPLYEFIMLKNQRRSLKVREQSKQKLMAQVKPFSFARDKECSKSFGSGGHGSAGLLKAQPNTEKGHQSHTHSSSGKDVLNNMKPIKSRRACSNSHFKTVNHFKANPAPPRTKALMSAMKLKEQQEYRELKKRLRAEALMKNSTLPPSMATRDKRLKLCNAKLDSLIQEYQNSYNKDMENNNNRCGRITYRDQHSTDVDVDTAFTDDDRLSEDSYAGGGGDTNKTSSQHGRRRPRNFTPFGKSRHSSAASGIFECTSNDNLASRLRIQSTRKREAERMKREEEELLKLMKNENRRKKLRDSHLHAWRRAHSYSSSQDIAMRRQLRMAASILERESFVRDMSTMLSRVRSAPLLLEGVRERKFEPCKKHKEEFLQLSDRYSAGGNKPSTPRFTRTRRNWHFDRFGDEQSETVAMAEGSLTNSDNDDEVANFASDSDENSDDEPTEFVKKNTVEVEIGKEGIEKETKEVRITEHEKSNSPAEEDNQEDETDDNPSNDRDPDTGNCSAISPDNRD